MRAILTHPPSSQSLLGQHFQPILKKVLRKREGVKKNKEFSDITFSVNSPIIEDC
jgi:hypothetical protein